MGIANDDWSHIRVPVAHGLVLVLEKALQYQAFLLSHWIDVFQERRTLCRTSIFNRAPTRDHLWSAANCGNSWLCVVSASCSRSVSYPEPCYKYLRIGTWKEHLTISTFYENVAMFTVGIEYRLRRGLFVCCQSPIAPRPEEISGEAFRLRPAKRWT